MGLKPAALSGPGYYDQKALIPPVEKWSIGLILLGALNLHPNNGDSPADWLGERDLADKFGQTLSDGTVTLADSARHDG